MPSNKQRRQAAQRRLQRQLERRAELARKRRRTVLIGVTAVAVLLVLGAVWLITGVGGDDPADSAAAGPTPSSTAPVVDGSDGTCDFTADASGNPDLTDVGTPPAEVTPSGTTALTMTTNFGPVGLTLDQANAPCAGRLPGRDRRRSCASSGGRAQDLGRGGSFRRPDVSR